MVKTASTASLPSQYRTRDLYGPWNSRDGLTIQQIRERRQQYLEKKRQQYRKSLKILNSVKNFADED